MEINNRPQYLYGMPMFAITVSIVPIIENGVLLVESEEYEKNKAYKFPSAFVKAGVETIQFAAVRCMKETTNIVLKKGDLMPVDFRSDPTRSQGGNIVDFGFVCFLDKQYDNYNKAIWKEVDFEKKCMIEKLNFFMDHNLLLERAIEISGILK